MSRILKFGFTVGILALVGCQGGARMVSLTKPAVHVASTRIGALLLPAEFRGLHAQLEQLYQQPVVFDPYFDGATIGKQLASGRADFAILSSREYAQIPEQPRCELVAAALNADGKAARKAVIVAKADSELKSLADCKGRRFVFGPGGDLLLEHATIEALRKGGVEPKELTTELPPLSLDGRLRALGGSAEIAKVVAFDLTVSAGVVDEVTWKSLPDSGGSILSGASKDKLRIIGETEAVPEMVVVASPKTDPARVQMLREFLLAGVTKQPEVCQQLGVSGFREADETLYADARRLLSVK